MGGSRESCRKESGIGLRIGAQCWGLGNPDLGLENRDQGLGPGDLVLGIRDSAIRTRILGLWAQGVVAWGLRLRRSRNSWAQSSEFNQKTQHVAYFSAKLSILLDEVQPEMMD